MDIAAALAFLLALVVALPKLAARIELSAAKHRSLAGHARIARLVARWVPYYAYEEEEFFRADGAPA
ncbi:MAG TPA: glutamate-1-semialdehyde 2,1-aminomutase, partial [Casimicrobiaceae bacterium]